MIRKENLEIKEMNRKMISRAAMKPDLNAFPVKDISVPFNSSRNTPGLRQMALEKPVSFLENNLGIANQIEEIRNNREQKNLNRNTMNNVNGMNNRNGNRMNNRNGNRMNNVNGMNNGNRMNNRNGNTMNNRNENLELKVVDLEDDYQNNVSLSPAETFNKVKEVLNNIQNEIALEDELEERKKPKNIIYLPPGVSIPKPPSDEEMMRNTKVVKRNESNNLVRSIMDIKRGSSVSKQMVILFFVVMAILIYSGQHRRLLR